VDLGSYAALSVMQDPVQQLTTSSTQAPSSIKTILLGGGISSEKADELNERYNRRSIPIIDDELFFKNLSEIAAESAQEEVESKL
jgi:hypothetical protein